MFQEPVLRGQSPPPPPAVGAVSCKSGERSLDVIISRKPSAAAPKRTLFACLPSPVTRISLLQVSGPLRGHARPPG